MATLLRRTRELDLPSVMADPGAVLRNRIGETVLVKRYWAVTSGTRIVVVAALGAPARIARDGNRLSQEMRLKGRIDGLRGKT